MRVRRYEADYNADEWAFEGLLYTLRVPLLAMQGTGMIAQIKGAVRQEDDRLVVELHACDTQGCHYANTVTAKLPAAASLSLEREVPAWNNDEYIRHLMGNIDLVDLEDNVLTITVEHRDHEAWRESVVSLCRAANRGDSVGWFAEWDRMLNVLDIGNKPPVERAEQLSAACGYTLSYLLTTEMRPCLDHVLSLGVLTASAVRHRIRKGLVRSAPQSHDDSKVPLWDRDGYLPTPLVRLIGIGSSGEHFQTYACDRHFVDIR